MGKNSKYIISIDLGTSYIKAGLYNTKGQCLNIQQNKIPHKYSKDGGFEQLGDDFIKYFIKTLKSIVDKNISPKEDIEAISFTGQMGGVIGIDEKWNTSTIWSGTMDTRQNLNIADGIDHKKVLSESGTNFPLMAKKIKWFEDNNGNTSGKILKFLGLSSYVIGSIADLEIDDAFLESTYLTWTGIADIKNRNWSDELCSMFGINKKKLPRIVDSKTIVGKLSKTIASSCGLLEGTPIVAGAGDKVAGCIGAGAVDPGMLVEECASVAALSLCVDNYKPDVENKILETLPSAIKGQYYSIFFIPGSGLAMDWFVDNFAEEEKEAAINTNTTAFNLLDKKAEKINPGSDNLICVGLLGGRALPNQPNIRGIWIGHSFYHTKAHFYRALLESYAYEYKNCLTIMKKQFDNLHFSNVRVIGGGSSSKLWNKIKANVLEMPYDKMNRSDITLLGTAIIGGVGVGLFDDIEKTSKKFSEVKERFNIDRDQLKKYSRMSSLYFKVIKNNENIFDELREEN